MGTAGGIMEDMVSDETMTHLTFAIPSRGTMGLKTKILNVTHGEACCSITSITPARFRARTTSPVEVTPQSIREPGQPPLRPQPTAVTFKN